MNQNMKYSQSSRTYLHNFLTYCFILIIVEKIYITNLLKYSDSHCIGSAVADKLTSYIQTNTQDICLIILYFGLYTV